MSESYVPNLPFRTLGNHLKYLREQSKESLAEVSGAVEIDERILERIETGVERPDEDILMLLMSHYGAGDQEAVQLWQLAGYEGLPDTIQLGDNTAMTQRAVVMLLALDSRIFYTDGFEVQCGPAGVTLTFTQGNTQLSPASPVSRVGMSYDQAYQVLQTLQQGLLKAQYLRGPKALPPDSASGNEAG